ncbi:MAG: hypothetical protein LCH83_00010 [Proteobacteria bacterium]|nr:hypothetical protein [Pseudomonadota bacterium]
MRVELKAISKYGINLGLRHWAAEANDYSDCTTWGMKDNQALLLNELRRQIEHLELKLTIAEYSSQHKALVILIEDKASGNQLIYN